MKHSATLVLVLVFGLACTALGAGNPVFPHGDNCRRSTSSTRWSLSLIKQQVDPNKGSLFCWKVDVKPSSQCSAQGTRCCNTAFSKIKAYVNPACGKGAFGKMEITNNHGFSKIVSPVWTDKSANTTNIKWTQFGPIPQNKLAGTVMCMRMAPASKGNKCHTLASITNPSAPHGKLQMAMYDRKQRDYKGQRDYECCPVFNFAC